MRNRLLRGVLAAFILLGLAELVDLAWLYQARATISSTSTTIVALGNGSITVFNFPFVGVQASDIVVIYTDTSGNQTTLPTTQYTVSLNAAGQGQLWGIGGAVTYPLAGAPIASGTTLTISRSLPLTQTVSSNQGQRFPLAVETALDLIAMQVQQVNALFGRALVVPVTDTCAPLGNLPSTTQRASQLLGFDSTGCNPIAAQPSSALVSSAMQPVVAAPSIGAANTLLGINTNFNVPVGAEVDWPGLTAPSFWKLEDGSAISRTTYSGLLGVIAPVVPCTISNGSSTITGISSTVGWGTGWVIESPGSAALGSGRTIATVGASSVTINGGAATTNATSCQIFPYGTAQDGTFNVPDARGYVFAGLDTGSLRLDTATCTGNPAYLNAPCGAKNTTLITGNLPAYTPSGTINIVDPGHHHLEQIDVYGNDAAAGKVADASGSVTATYTQNTSDATTGLNSGNVTLAGAAQGGTSTPFSQLQPTRIRQKIIFLGAP